MLAFWQYAPYVLFCGILLLPFALRLAYAATNRWLRPRLKLPTIFVDLVLMFVVFMVCLAGPPVLFQTLGWQVQQWIAQAPIQQALNACPGESLSVGEGTLRYDDARNTFVWEAQAAGTRCAFDTRAGEAAAWICDC